MQLLDEALTAFRQQWPALAQLAVYVRGAGERLDLGAAVPADPPAAKTLESAAARAPDATSGPATWVIPLAHETGVLQAEWTAPDAHPDGLGAALHGLAATLGAALHHQSQQPASGEVAQPKQPVSRLRAALRSVSQQLDVHLATKDILQTICQNLITDLELAYTVVLSVEVPAQQVNILAEYPVRLGTEEHFALDDLPLYAHFQAQTEPVAIPAAKMDELLGTQRTRFERFGIKALLAAPLLAQTDVIGLLLLATDETGRVFGSDELDAARALATQLALGLRNAEMFTEMQRRSNQLERIGAFGRLITSTFERREILHRVMDVLPNLLPTDEVSLTLYTPGQSRMQTLVLVSHKDPVESDELAAETSVATIVQTQTPMNVPDITTSEYPDHQRMAQRGMRALLSAPLVIGGRAMGTVNIANKRPHSYTPTDLTLLQQFGNQIAIALENARQFQMTRHRAQYEESLNEISSHLQEQGDLRSLLQQTMQDLGEILGARWARVRLQTPSGPQQAKE